MSTMKEWTREERYKKFSDYSDDYMEELAKRVARVALPPALPHPTEYRPVERSERLHLFRRQMASLLSMVSDGRGPRPEALVLSDFDGSGKLERRGRSAVA